MPKRKDENETAFNALQEIIRRDAVRNGLQPEPLPKEEKVSYRAQAGSKGGVKGGRVRAEKLSPKQRREIAQKAARARWNSKLQSRS